MNHVQVHPQIHQAYAALEQEAGPEAEALLRPLLQEEPYNPIVLNGLGRCAELRGDFTEAENHYRQALNRAPQECEILNNLGICLQRQQRHTEALNYFAQICAVAGHPSHYYNLALAQTRAGQYWQALESLKPVLHLDPSSQLPLLLIYDLMEFLVLQTGSYEKLKNLSSQHPNEALYHLALGAYFEFKNEEATAAQYFHAALKSTPELMVGYQMLIKYLQGKGQYTQALHLARRLNEQKFSPPNLPELILSLQNPLPASQAEVTELRHELETVLAQHAQALEGLKQRLFPASIPFYTVYQHGIDRPLQEKLARFLAPLAQTFALSKSPKAKPRLGIISSHLYQHSVTHLLQRALKTLLQSDDFESFVFYRPRIQTDADEFTQELKDLADHFFYLHLQVPETARQVARQNLDILIYPDVGMEAFNYLMALHRLAPHQLVLPGHPVTTGMPTMDYFISGKSLETPTSDTLYSETLIRLPGLPDYEPVTVPEPASRQDLGLPEGHLYFCPMTLFKIQPSFDAILAELLKRDPQARILLLSYKNNLHLQLRQRLTQNLGAKLTERIHFLPWSTRSIFFQRLMAVDAVIDSFYFGGGNTSYQALGLGVPIVTLNQPWNKGRWTQAMYQLMGVEGLVAESTQEYVQLAIKLATDREWQAQKRAEILAKKDILFDNPTWSEALLQFCQKLA